MNTLALWPIRGHVQRTSWHRHRSRSRLHGFETITSRAEITAPPLRSTRDHHQLPRRTWPVSVIAWWPRALLPRLLLFFSLRGKEEKRSGEADPIRLDRWRLGGIPNQTPSSHPIPRLGWPSQATKRGCRSAERRASMVRALDRYSSGSGKDVAYRFAALGPGWLLSLV